MPKCTMCQSQVPNVFGDHDFGTVQPDNGLHISIHTGYGMFDDPMDEEVIETLQTVVLCHDCSVRVINLFPEEFRKLFQGGHPYNGDTPCCSFAWSADSHASHA